MFGMDSTVLALAGLVGFAVAATIYALFYGQISNSAARARRLDLVSGPQASRTSRGSKVDSGAARRKNVQESLKEMEEKQKHKAARSTNPPLRIRLSQAGLKISTGRFFAYSAATGILLFVVFIFTGQSLLLSLAAGLVGTLGLPRLAVNMIRKRRLNIFIDELPNAIDVIVRGIKAGLPLNDCLRMIASEAREPLRSEFRIVVEALSVGVPIDEAMAKLYERVPLPEANFFGIVLAIQAKTGGNLSEALGNLTRVLRDRKKMRGKIKAMSSEAKASAGIIGSLPIVVMALVSVTSPDYIGILWTDPRGQIILGVSVLVMVCGILVMRKMINFDF